MSASGRSIVTGFISLDVVVDSPGGESGSDVAALKETDGGDRQNLRLVGHDTCSNGIQRRCYEVVR